ncbi:FAD/NAD(P)-binding domain-containing protein [Lindgomyces ingoldianus]|uniref:FAD/NAD(P)-binding domain-containing protein n=1 Tax=Lindgomyces ingoldianus TaxID=673940 RepID=A0ACB6Q999_9PLEO|nr:FAD/NAD(P)-binding domain-containing protein [Lindgomyces ingoldianus]KAF2463479.1 FAD/NAD(P)-binding domain-containing protein [Lindgomyces ingoldianus]
MERKRIAIVGSGVSGVSALWTLKNTQHEVHLFEKEDRLGGHTNTVTWESNGHSTPVDTGFIVLNTATYPNFIAFLASLKIKTIASEMTFGISRDQGAFEWSGTSLSALFAQPTNLFKPSFWRMIFDIVRFNQFSLDLLSTSSSSPVNNISIGEYLEKEGYSDAFKNDYLIPMTACVWSTGPDKCALEFPVLTLVRFMWNHHLLTTVAERPPWLTIEGGSKKYINAAIRECTNAKVHLGVAVESATRKDGKVILRLGGEAENKVEWFDEVILACHGDQAFKIIRQTAEPDETDILSVFETTPNTAYLHSDLSLMPQRHTAWSAWNYLATSQRQSKPSTSVYGAPQTVTLTYNMNILQSLPTNTYGNILVTMNPANPPNPSLTQATFHYRHPLYTAPMVAAQERLEWIQGKRGIWYAGAWTGYGFHEDGFASGMRVGLRLGGEVTWEVKDANFSRGSRPVLDWKDYAVRIVILGLQLFITVLERVLVVHRMRGTPEGNGVVHVNGFGARNGKPKEL